MGTLIIGIVLLAAVSVYGVYMYSSQGNSDLANLGRMVGDLRGDIVTFSTEFKKLYDEIQANNTRILSLEDSSKKLSERIIEIEKVPKADLTMIKQPFDVRILSMPGRVTTKITKDRKIEGKVKLTPLLERSEIKTEGKTK